MLRWWDDQAVRIRPSVEGSTDPYPGVNQASQRSGGIPERNATVKGLENESAAIASQDSIGDRRARDAERGKMLDAKKAWISSARDPDLQSTHSGKRGGIGIRRR